MDYIDYKIRKIDIKEIEKLIPLFEADDNEQFMNERIERIVKNDIDIYVVEYKDKFIGEVTIVYNNVNYKDYTILNKRVYMEAFRILKKHQGKGIGQYLLNEVINKVKKQGYSEITIGVEDDNENARHIYSKYGFTEFIRRDYGDKYDLCYYNVYLKRL